MQMRDLHVHTKYCDGKAEPEEYILCAIEKGLECIGFSVHSYVPFDLECCIAKERIPEYKAEIRALSKKYDSKIKVLCGVEQDYYSEEPTDGYDYVIGSVHYYKSKNGVFIPFDLSGNDFEKLCSEYFGGDYYALCEEYYRLVGDVARKTKADIIGHFDLVTKYNGDNLLFDTQNPRYVSAYLSAAKKLAICGAAFEINTGAIIRGYKTDPYPSESIIKALVEHGAKFVLSSDAHTPSHLGYDFEKYGEWAKALGTQII